MIPDIKIWIMGQSHGNSGSKDKTKSRTITITQLDQELKLDSFDKISHIKNIE